MYRGTGVIKFWGPRVPTFIIILGTPLRTRRRVPRGYSTLFNLVIQSLLHTNRVGCTSPLISRFQMATLQTGSTAACSDNEQVDVEDWRFGSGTTCGQRS